MKRAARWLVVLFAVVIACGVDAAVAGAQRPDDVPRKHTVNDERASQRSRGRPATRTSTRGRALGAAGAHAGVSHRHAAVRGGERPHPGRALGHDLARRNGPHAARPSAKARAPQPSRGRAAATLDVARTAVPAPAGATAPQGRAATPVVVDEDMASRRVVDRTPRAVDDVGDAVDVVVESGAVPLVLAVLVALFVLLQNRIDRRDPKLAVAPVRADPELVTFE